MSTGAVSAPSETADREAQVAHWSLATRIGFRFTAIYFGLFCLATQILGGLFPVPTIEIPDLASRPPIRPIVLWTAAHVFGIQRELVYKESGSGDKTFDWVLAFCVLIFAALAAGAWSVLDRKRESYAASYRWFRLFLRFALASELLLYGMDKAIPLQMPFPYLTRLVEPYGNFSPMGNLWSFIGASRPYEICVGCAEILGGILLIFPRTAMLGAMVAFADMTQVFLLNMTYDVPVKLFSFHLLLMATVLLAPDLSRLWRFFVLNRATEPAAGYSLFRSRRANRIALAAQVFLGLWIIGVNAYNGAGAWKIYGGGRPKSPLYGIWNVTSISTGGASAVPAYNRWRRVIFDFPGGMSVQQMDDSIVNYGVTIGAGLKTLALTGNGSPTSRGEFSIQQTGRNDMTLIGSVDGQSLHIDLRLFDRNKFRLVNRGFHWVQEYPFNR